MGEKWGKTKKHLKKKTSLNTHVASAYQKCIASSWQQKYKVLSMPKAKTEKMYLMMKLSVY